MLIFLRSSNYHIDGRLYRYTQLLKNKIGFNIVYWDRKNECESNDFTKFAYSGVYGNGIKSIFGFLLWNFFIIKYLFSNRKEISYVHAINLDTIIPVLLMKIFCKYKVIYDIYDCYADSHSYKGIINKLVKIFEKVCCYYSDLIIIPHECRIKQSSIKKMLNKILIVENVPLIPDVQQEESFEDRISFIYAGNLQKDIRGIENIINMISLNDKYHLIICGDGELKEYCKLMSESFDNIDYRGSISYSDMITTMSNCDIIVGMYYTSCPNHIYASPNKYYEHLALAKPLLTTLNTPPGDDVLRYNTGWAIGEDSNDIGKLLTTLSQNNIRLYSDNAKKLWVRKYKNYYDDCIEMYIKKLKEL